jgi:hypothetical protein
MENTVNELSPSARRLIAEVGDADGPSVLRRARVKQRLAAQLAVSGVALGTTKLAAAVGAKAAANAGAVLSATALGTASTSVGAVALWLMGGALAGAVVMAPIVLNSPSVREDPMRATLSARTITSTPVVVPSSGVRVAPAEQAAKRIAQEPVVKEAKHAPKRERPASRASAEKAAGELVGSPSGVVNSPARASLGAETELLNLAQRELAAGQGERALELLQRHEQRFPAAALSEERMFARVIALCQLGREVDALAAAEAFLRAAPRSPFLPRLRKSCAFSGSQPQGSKP